VSTSAQPWNIIAFFFFFFPSLTLILYNILSLGGSSSGSPPPHSPGLVYPFCMDSNCYPCDLTKVQHKSSLRFSYCLLIWMDAVHILRVDILVFIYTWDCRL
jgi:hypothetical protein